MIKSPSASDVYELCDWAELRAIGSFRGTTTRGDLVKYIQGDDSLVDEPGVERDESAQDERIADDVLSLALERQRILGDSYPFDLEHGLIRAKSGRVPSRMTAYLFHLFLAGLESSVVSSVARHQFEREVQRVLGEFFGGDTFHFGWTKLNAQQGRIQRRIEVLCDHARNSLRWTPKQLVSVSPTRNDLGLDVLVWRTFTDRRANSLVFLVQCATGSNWRTKIQESSSQLLEDCLVDARDGPWIDCFCTPHHIPSNIWRETARANTGIVFDRLRLVLALLAGGRSHSRQFLATESLQWAGEMLGRIGRKADSRRKRGTAA